MIRIIVENHAHRLLKNGIVESAEYQEAFDTNEFRVVDPVEDLNMSSGDFFFIRKQLEILHGMFPSGRPGVPKSEKIENVSQDVKAEKL